MDAIHSHNICDLMTVRRLMIKARENDLKRADPNSKTTSAKEAFEEDQALFSGSNTNKTSEYCQQPKASMDNLDVKLKDIIHTKAESGVNPNHQFVFQELIDVQMDLVVEEESLTVVNLERVDGLVLKNSRMAETDRYRFDFIDGSTLKITDKWASRSTTIWGDPHIDSSDIEGNWDGDFKDLKQSNSHTTFMLQDGTRLTITAKDDGIIEAVDIFRQGQHIYGLGAGSRSFSDKTGYFQKPGEGSDKGSMSVELGDVIYAGGDGNDWYDAGKKLIWGKVTGPQVISRPSSVLVYEYQKVEISVGVTAQVIV